MKRFIRTTLILAAVVFAATLANAAVKGLATQSGSKLWLTGTSTMHAFESTASRLEVTFKSAAELPAAATPGESVERMIRDHGVTGLDVRVVVKDLHSHKDGLDKNMYKALQAEKYPEIRFLMTGYDVTDGAAPGTIAVAARGKLTVAGVEREVQVPVTARREANTMRLTGEVPLLMSQFGIKPPTMMMGTIKTGDKVVIHFDLPVGANEGTTAARPDGSSQ